jgi:hypothetical protein
MTVNEEDLALVKFAGMLGHTHVAIVGEPGQRHIKCEASSLADARRIADYDPTLRVYRHVGHGWQGCKMTVPE